MAFNLPEYYTRGAGKLLIGDRDLTTGTLAGTGLEFLGDTSEFTLDVSQDFAEHKEHQSGDGRKDVRVPTALTVSGQMVVDNTGADNLRRFLQGVTTPVAGATITDEAYVAPGPGKAIVLQNPVETFTALADGVETKTAGTDYVVDGRAIYFPVGSTVAAEANITVDYVSASHKTVDLFANRFKEFYLYFDGINTVYRKQFSLELFKVSLDAASLGSLLGDDMTLLTIPFEALFEPLQADLSNLSGYGNYTIVD